MISRIDDELIIYKKLLEISSDLYSLIYENYIGKNDIAWKYEKYERR